MTAYEREQHRLELFTDPFGKYNYYQLNADNAVIGALLSEYAKIINMYAPMGDTQRICFEKFAWRFFAGLYKKNTSQMQFDIPRLAVPEKSGGAYLPLEPQEHISKRLFGWRRERLEIFIDGLDREKAVSLFRKAVRKWTSQKA